MLRVIYLVFTEGYAASPGRSLTRHDLSGEAIRLGRLLLQLLPEPEVYGIAALMLFQESPCARTSATGDLVLLEEQRRSAAHRTRTCRPASAARLTIVEELCPQRKRRTE